MLSFTIIMIIAYTGMLVLSTITKELFSKSSEEFAKESKETQVVTVLLVFIIAGIMLAHSITNLIYLFYSLNVDPLQYPTYVMLGLIVLNLIMSAIRSIYRKITKTEPSTKTTPYGYLIRIITYLYFVYMLYILIVGI